MDFLDDIKSYGQYGVDSAQRSVQEVRLKRQIGEIARRRKELMAQLGASLYEVTKDNPELRQGREALYDSIAQCDKARELYERQIADLHAVAPAAPALTCPNCGASVQEGDVFCMNCGQRLEHVAPAEPAGEMPTPFTGVPAAISERTPYDGMIDPPG